ncbi:hypothetical protein C0995_014101 [Termitomyces sp. Mi166|nr:hypothetical protein C0995_014101 [Termitomyces sp. Mi166\
MVIYCYKIINACAGKFTDQCIQGLQANPDVEGIYEDGLGGIPRGKNLDFAHVDQANSLTRSQANSDVEEIYENGLGASEKQKAIHKYLNIRTNATWALARMSSKAKLNYTSITYRLTLVDVQGGEPHLLKGGMEIIMVMELTAPGTTWGVAKKANIISVRILNWRGIAGLDWVYGKAIASGRPSVVSFSASWEACQPLDDAIEKLADRRIPAVVSAGNDGKNASSRSPARAPSAITIAASNIDDEQTEISNYGESVFMFAPGEAIYSTDIGHRFSTALVAGIVASFLKDEKWPTLKIMHELQKASLQDVLKDNGYASDEKQE